MKKLPKINAAQVLKASLPYVINGCCVPSWEKPTG